jgi:hypothetical protein
MGDERDVVDLSAAEREEILKRVRELDLSSCDFVGDSGCVDPDCWRCHSPLSPENLRTLAQNLATVALLCFAWGLRDACPAWSPGCEKTPSVLPSFMEGAIRSDHVGSFLRKGR